MRLILLTGKGGVGKTTVAAATAVHAARLGVKTLVASADPAHSLADALGTPVGAAPTEVDAHLYAQQVDPRARAERSYDEVRRYLTGALHELGVDPIAAEELTELPGAEEVVSLLEVRDQVRDGAWDLVVLDCAPSAETLRLLALPEVLLRAVRRLLPMERRISRVLARGAGAAMSAAGVPPPPDHVVTAAERLSAELAGVRDVLAAPTTSARLVLTAESVVLAETRRTWTSLALHGYAVDQVVANRVFGGGDAWRDGWVRAQQGVLAEAEASFAPVPVLRAGYAAAEPVGLPALASFAESLYGPAREGSAAALLAPPAPAPGLAVERADGGFVLRLDLPLAGRDELGVGRRGDDLVVSVAGRTRVLALPSALRRCTVAGASLRDGRLAVRFEPDPALWPAARGTS